VSTPRHIAVVGGGVAGLTAAWVLQRAGEQVTLFEKDDRLGGHADTHDVVDSRGRLQHVDTGFIVHNERTYPTLLRLFSELGVATRDSDMSMSVRCDGCGLEYAGARGAAGLFATPRSARPAYLRMLTEVLRFHRQARALLASGQSTEETLGAFLDRGGFSSYFRAHFMTPVVSCVWSCAPDLAEQYPARYLFSFLEHHGMLQVTGSPTWRTVEGGSARYVERVGKALGAVRTSTPVTSLERTEGGVLLRDADDQLHRVDAVVVATHPHQALALLARPTPLEREVLGAISYSRNATALHTDTTLLPRSRGAQASWNYLMSCTAPAQDVVVSYDMNRLQGLDSPERFVVTLNGGEHVDPGQVIDTMDYEHPLYTPASVAAQRRLPELSDHQVAYAGAYHGWGFHEDGARSGVEAARLLGVSW
jgi:predicted NAD/FAD-binding protein